MKYFKFKPNFARINKKLSEIYSMLESRTDSFLVFGVLWSLLMRFSVSRWPHSGQGKYPMYGDFEAHRHWMEITVNLPVKEWYKNSSLNDLQYWGLDYPPISAYQSMIFGYIAKWINPEWVALNSSRGQENYDLKFFMRSTVLLLDILIFILPNVLYWLLIHRPRSPRNKAIAASVMLFYPGFILIDHGHFQYNTVCLGLVLSALLLLMFDYEYSCAALYTLSLHYKQISLYYALPFFFYLLGRCVRLPWKLMCLKFCKLGMVVILTSTCCWFPFIQDLETFKSVISRIFPVARGLYEDKVSNFWCAVSVLIKLRNLMTNEHLALLCTASTLLAVIPSCISLLKRPTYHAMLLALVNSSLGFFLFSYQVHEKSILFAALPVLLLIESYPLACISFCYVSLYSLIPLLVKDDLYIPFLSLSVMFLSGCFVAYEDCLGLNFKNQKAAWKTVGFLASLVISLIIECLRYLVWPPARYPHIFIMLNCIYCCLHFIGFALYFNFLLYKGDRGLMKKSD